MTLHIEGSWLQKFWEGHSLSSGTWIPKASLWGLGVGGRELVNHLVLDHIRGCWSCHFMRWPLGERCQNLKVGEVGLVYNMCTDGIVLQLSNVWQGASHLTPNSGCFLKNADLYWACTQHTLYQNQVSGDTKIVTLILVLFGTGILRLGIHLLENIRATQILQL